MFRKIKNYKIILIKGDDFNAVELTPKKLILPLSILSFFFIIFTSLFLFSSEIKEIITLRVITKHKENNEKLYQTINNQKEQINTLIEEIDKIYVIDEKLRKLVKLPPINDDVRKLGVGGNVEDKDFKDFNYLIPYEIDLNKMSKDIDYIFRSVNLEKLSYSLIQEEVKEHKNYLLSYPAIYPIAKEDRKFSSRFGYRRDPFSKRIKLHEGDDFSTKVGVDVMATADGVVKTSKYYGSFGNFIEIDHGNGYVTAYGHLSKRNVEKGQKIERGQIIGKVGNTGRSTAPHLHYEVRLNAQHLNPKNFYFN